MKRLSRWWRSSSGCQDILLNNLKYEPHVGTRGKVGGSPKSQDCLHKIESQSIQKLLRYFSLEQSGGAAHQQTRVTVLQSPTDGVAQGSRDQMSSFSAAHRSSTRRYIWWANVEVLLLIPLMSLLQAFRFRPCFDMLVCTVRSSANSSALGEGDQRLSRLNKLD